MNIELATNLVKITLEIVGLSAMLLSLTLFPTSIIYTLRVGFKNAQKLWVSSLCVLVACIISFAAVFSLNRCPNCKTYCNSTFCTECGTQIGEQNPTPTLCPSCGVEWGESWQFCGDCGSPLGVEVE